MKSILTVTLAAMISIGLLAAPAQATDWTASTSLSLKASQTHVKQGTKITFTIKLKSNRKPCYQNEPVKWYRNGVYKKTLHTNNKGVIKLQKKAPAARIRIRFERSARRPSGTPVAAYSRVKAVPSQPT